MYFATLASGSSGNAILVGGQEGSFLIDCGIAMKNILKNLSTLDIEPAGLKGIIVTHEHTDHVKGIGPLARKLGIPIYATAGLWAEMNGSIGKIGSEQRVVVEREMMLAGMQVNLFETSHDSRESYGIKIREGRLALGIATDSGTVTEDMDAHLQGCDAFIVEANHDVEALWNGRYPWSLKKRVNSNYGHLSNNQLSEALAKWIEGNTKKVVLAHLSEENNTPELAMKTVYGYLKKSEVSKRCPGLKIRVAPRHIPHELIVME
ncbi:hypothetical protein Sgly_3321 [Syntrophobotulus glycolicus DSM 8271]|uniref:Metallo-beta-lactamase domain-containing protein n=1 Tax=Syntrophobotulus glycolicus (strain DSM 8271 / FlGlyR) TaxID=645991 RepID=F0T2U7_SYNGF|nr:MBL fold metallo-hydrolase [Syntrophobotulus glycolicus]ADY57584.1 hypothetical protein Sgly_3321 [Syntrophobotulus glycolicus DSM 8271]